jgi:hypothetical protein
MPYQLRNRNHVANAESMPSGAASTVALKFSGTLSTAREGSSQEHESDKPELSKGPKTKRLRSCGFPDGGDQTSINLPLAGNTVLTTIRITKRDRRCVLDANTEEAQGQTG